ncbi:hypothetical protein KCP71_12065 [Salmonella enterica subsp. enterica]|nr:hypothetical protein KCP71_12065 [Salmonella enterica subsp. enterica]
MWWQRKRATLCREQSPARALLIRWPCRLRTPPGKKLSSEGQWTLLLGKLMTLLAMFRCLNWSLVWRCGRR